MRKYLYIIPLLMIIYILTLNEKFLILEDSFIEDNEVKKEEEKSEIAINEVAVFYNGENKNMSIDDYVIHVLACEMPASFNLEALKAGAIAIRTFYIYKSKVNIDYIATNNDQCFINEQGMREKWTDSYDKFYNIIKQAVDDTKGKYISYEGNPIESFYFSMSNGYTETSENVFSESKPYLISVDSKWDKDLKNYEKSVTLNKNDFLTKLNLPLSTEVNVDIKSRSESDRVNVVVINGIEFKGTDFRKKLGIRSTDFDLDINDENIIITTRGYGHGVGLSQYGANEMAKLGYSFEDILKHYYKGVEISTI